MSLLNPPCPSLPGEKIGWPRTRRCSIVAQRMKSMTGYGWGEHSEDGFKVTVELSSVNRKQSDVVVTLPRELTELEPRVRDAINAEVARGRLTVVIGMHYSQTSTQRPSTSQTNSKRQVAESPSA